MSTGTGRFYVTKGSRTFCIDPRTRPLEWGDVNPATGEVMRQVQRVYPRRNRLITENKFKNIMYTGVDASPLSVIENQLK